MHAFLAFSVATNGDLACSNGALSCRDDHSWRRGRNLCALPLQTTNDYSEIARLNEDEILMPAVTGVLFKWPLIRQIRGRSYGTGNGSDVGQTCATIPLIRKDQPKSIFWRLLNTTTMSTSIRNRLPGTIEKIVSDKVVSEIVIRTAAGNVTSIITTGSVKRMDLKEGDTVFAIIKATEVSIEKE